MVARTTIDLNLQHAAEESLEFMLRQHGKQYRVEQGALVMLETNGAVRALVGGRDYGTSQFNRATKALRQSGSSFKPYVYATAMENGFKPESVISDGPINWNGWSPQNYARSFSGRMTLSTALIKSTNTVPVRLTKEHLGVGPVKAMAESFGVESKLEGHKTMVLGTSGMTVMDQATGYEVFANGGYAGMRHGITQLANHSGKVFYDRDRDAAKPRRVLSEQATASMNSILVQIPEIGTARRAALPGIRTAGKTGTTQAYRDAWFVGFTGNYLAAVWMGNDDFKPTNEMTGGVLPAMVWQRLMAYAHRNVELKPIPGIEKPFIEMPTDPQAIASLAADGGANPTDETPRILSPATTRVLVEIEAAFGGSKPASASLSDKLSAL
jgi:penicillin-binding protein 1A